MAREKELYRENLERIMAYYPGKEVLSMKEVEKYTGREKRALLNSDGFPAKKMGGHFSIPITALARWLCV